jgi:hypothetical protein
MALHVIIVHNKVATNDAARDGIFLVDRRLMSLHILTLVGLIGASQVVALNNLRMHVCNVRSQLHSVTKNLIALTALVWF